MIRIRRRRVVGKNGNAKVTIQNLKRCTMAAERYPRYAKYRPPRRQSFLLTVDFLIGARGGTSLPFALYFTARR